MKEAALLICDNHVSGIFTAIYDAYLLKCDELYTKILTKPCYQGLLGAKTIDVVTDYEKAEKVANTLKKKFSADSVSDIFCCAASHDENKADYLYHSIALGLGLSKVSGTKKTNIMAHLANPYVLSLSKLARNVSCELHHLMGFLRFEKRDTDILFAMFCPKNDLLSLIMPHFADRLTPENFIIFDSGRKTFGVHPAHKDWFLADFDWLYADTPQAKAVRDIFERTADDDDAAFASLFKQFCKAVSVTERENLTLMRNHLPLRFREFMTEFK